MGVSFDTPVVGGPVFERWSMNAGVAFVGGLGIRLLSFPRSEGAGLGFQPL